LIKRQNDQERRAEHQAILNWLTSIDYAPQQSDLIKRRQEGTGEWLLKSSEFQEWLGRSKQTLFCPGIPGAGKTMMSSIVVDHLNTKFENDAGIGIAYIYCNYQPQQQQKPEDLLSSLSKQLTQNQPAVPAEVKNLYKRHTAKRTRPSPDEIVRLLHSTVQLYSRVFIIIDALDEYHVSNNAGQNKLLSEVFSLQDQAQINLFATSRFVSEITSRFEGCILKEIRAQDDDILRYINERIPQLLRSQILKHPQAQDTINTIRSNVVKAVDGMYVHSSVNIYAQPD
jgi:Cdc6-like AAA superfamily ATPase